jgi:ectoine hydroxylase-related dioxygenase (phytanoyl-CoA dioxygenase family)
MSKTAPIQQNKLSALTQAEFDHFQNSGFLVIENLLEATAVQSLRDRFDPLFRGEFETGIYPDEWYWREGMSLPDVTRHMANAWKSDLTIANLVLSSEIARVGALLMGWDGTRLGQDTIWMKPPQTKAIALHQDSSFMDFLVPPETITCWTTLDDTQADAGTIEYVPGSHRWQLTTRPLDFHTPEGGYQAKMLFAAAQAGINKPQSIPIEVPAGSCVFHHGHIWHGSGDNTTANVLRRSIGIHLLPSQVCFHSAGGGYIYGRYQRVGDNSLDESFFPILWQQDGYRTPYLDRYCQSGERSSFMTASLI